MVAAPVMYLLLSAALSMLQGTGAFVAPNQTPRSLVTVNVSTDNDADQAKKDAALDAAIAAMFGGDSGNQEGPEATQMRIQTLVEEHPILLFMKS